MKIYTYYQNINRPYQQQLINLWKESWSRQGFEPIVLGLEHAKSHTYFKTLDTEMRKIFNVITGKTITDYGMSCWFRWLAYATQQQEVFYVSDYDAINANLPVREPVNKLHLMDSACPFLASGSPRQFEKLCESFVDVSNDRIETLKSQADHYHDQNFFIHNFIDNYNPECEKYKTKYEILMTRDRCDVGGIGDWYDPHGRPDPKTYGVFHVSSSNCNNFLKHKYKNYTHLHVDAMRIKLIEEILNIR